MVCDKEKCTGCSACFNVCPKQAITMQSDELGNIYPVIDKSKCINCGLCKKICPQLNDIPSIKPQKTYALYSKDVKKRMASTSGAAATIFGENIIANGGIVYGVSNLYFNNEFKFIRIDNAKDLDKIKGSKYVHAHVGTAFKDVKKDLIAGKTVMFVGTPCQIAGLKGFLMKDYGNLITVDIICHGVPSQQLFFEQLKQYGISCSEIYEVSFRNNERYCLTIYDKNKEKIFSKPSSLIPYFRNFLQGNIFRENCYSCKYAKSERISDITIGDFWGLDNNCKIKDDINKGISLVLVNSPKGLKLFENIKSKCVFEERTLEEAVNGNKQLQHPMSKNRKYDIFVNNYKKLGFKKTMKKMLSLKDKLKILIKKILMKGKQ